MLKVVKFGGSSMADAKQFEKVRNIILDDPARTVVIVSAAGKRFSGDHKLTDLLYLCHAHLQYGVSCDSVYEMICGRYIEVRDALGLKTDLESEFKALRERMAKGISQDELVSRGEYFSAMLMADYLGFTFLDAAKWLKFRLDGTVDTEKSYPALRELAAGKKVVIPGFYGAMPDGRIKTFSRGGSDISGALAAAALDADCYENWTDVSGILMADPRIVNGAIPIRSMTYSELRELSYLGAQVLHEQTILPVREKDIPLNIRNTNDPAHPGTIIREKFENEPNSNANFITGIAGKKNFTIVTLTKSGMSSQPGSLRKILQVFENYGVPISYAPSGIDCYSVVVETAAFDPCRYEVLAELEKEIHADKMKVIEEIAVVAVVGRKMVFRTGTSGKIFAKLGENGINIRMISQGPEELNIIIGVKNEDYEKAIQTLYSGFVEEEAEKK
ncbi:MAG: aspartate kinase [Oscillospiraceae bacterium]|nr:aspartate kinase [Oscillospiraceae bacterium]MBR2365541.1 aspartate kinase [Oscillospiraceae bacterium]